MDKLQKAYEESLKLDALYASAAEFDEQYSAEWDDEECESEDPVEMGWVNKKTGRP